MEKWCKKVWLISTVQSLLIFSWKIRTRSLSTNLYPECTTAPVVDFGLSLMDTGTSTVLQNLRELRQTQIDRNRIKSAKIDSGRFCSTKSTNTKSVKTNIKSVFRILVLVLFVLQNLPESILADLNRFRSIWVCLNSQRFCSTRTARPVQNSAQKKKIVQKIVHKIRHNKAQI